MKQRKGGGGSNSLSVSGLEAKRTHSRKMPRLIPVAESEAKLFSSETRDYYQWARYCYGSLNIIILWWSCGYYQWIRYYYRRHNIFLWCSCDYCSTRLYIWTPSRLRRAQMTSRKFNPGVTQTNKPLHGLLVWERCMKQRRSKTLQRDTQRLIRNSMASLAQSVDEIPRHVPWNNKNTEFKGRRQNMMGFSCRRDVYERTPYLHGRENIIIVPDIPVHLLQESQQASQRDTW